MKTNLTPNGEDTILEPGEQLDNAQNIVSRPPDDMDDIGKKLDFMLSKIETGVVTTEEAKAQLKTLIAEQVAAARIDELQLLDKNLESNKLRYYFKPYFDERLKQLQNKTNDGGRNGG